MTYQGPKFQLSQEQYNTLRSWEAKQNRIVKSWDVFPPVWVRPSDITYHFTLEMTGTRVSASHKKTGQSIDLGMNPD